jgi:nitrite reductase/ring-hydroxylating ferredoxin subunit
MLEARTRQGQFVDVVPLDALRDQFVSFHMVGGRGIVLTRLGDEVAAFDGTCTHARFHFCTSRLVEGRHIECPMHGGRFDGATGAPTKRPATRPLERLAVEVENGMVRVRVDWSDIEHSL